jgi:predicted MPP superfamily phosphohydrolase
VRVAGDIQVSRHVLRVPGLPPALVGARIAQVSDLHLYRGLHPAARRATAALDAERPDLIVLTGDQWDRRRGARALPDWLRELPRGCPVVAVLGNHEFSCGFSRAAAERLHQAGGAELLVNQARTVRVRGARLTLVGLDDYRHGVTDPARALADAPADVPQIWIQHEPEQMDATPWPAGARASLVLGGHTHGGQVRLPGLAAVTPRGSGRYVAGWYRSPVGPYYVSRGVGASGVRVRFGCPAELPIFTLAA